MSRSGIMPTAGMLPEIVVQPLSGSRLLRDYLAGTTAAAGFFSGHPADPAAYRRKAAEVDARLDPAARRRMAGSITALSAAARGKLARILDGGGYFVTTGQQTGLFTGPLYTVYKALSAIRLAGALEGLLGRPVLALFWAAADDHDWDEVCRATVLDGRGYPQPIELAARGDEPPLPMAERRLDESAARAVAELRDLLPATTFRDRLVPRLRAAYAPGQSMAAAFEATLAAVFDGQEIALVSSAHPLVKEHAAPVLLAALEAAERDETLVAWQTEALLRNGYHAQVSVAPGASNVFCTDEQGRDRLVREGGNWALRRTRRVLDGADLRARLAADPAAFSPNVLLRPVVESALFPTLAYVGGPAETSYFAQIGCLFQAHGIMPPVVFPRHSVTLVEPPVKRALARFGLDLAQLQRPLEEVLELVIRRDLPAGIMDELRKLRAGLADGYAALAEAAEAAAPGMHGPLLSARRQALAQVTAMEKKIIRHAEREQAARLEQLRRAAAQVQPGGAPQERALNVCPFLARYGPELLECVLAALTVRLGEEHPAFAGVISPEKALAAPSPRGIA